MWNRFATLTITCVLVVTGTARSASAEPLPGPPVQPVVNPDAPAPSGAVPAGNPGVLDTPDGWHIEVSARDEAQLPVAPLTTAVSSREYLVGGTFIGAVTGSGTTELTGGTLVAGYQIGCGVLADEIAIAPGASLDVGLPVPDFDVELGLDGNIDLLPGQISVVDVAEKEFEGTEARVTITGLRVNFDRCLGQSFIRSHATLSVSTEDTEDVITYLGVTKIV
ncbi:MspA family porin [Mycolicibacterium sp. F2034L]|uniref:MspA family porin n=1 Tax=Mycolicibacterium sp. F2034L TaxID=2926422 RepID=UPI0035A83F90